MKKLIFIPLFIILSIAGYASEPFQFVPTNGSYAGYAWNFCYDKQHNYLYANAGDIYRLNEKEDKWERVFSDLDSNDIGYQLKYADSIYFLGYKLGAGDEIWGFGILRSTDLGKTWVEIKDLDADIRSIIKLNNGWFLASGLGGVYLSKDLGLSWTKSNNGIDTNIIKDSWHFEQLEKMEVDGNEYIFLGNWDYGIFLSTDNGNNWKSITKSFIKDSLSWFDYTTMTTTPDKKVIISTEKGVFISSDFGNTWNLMINGLKGNIEYDFYFMKSDRYGNVFGFLGDMWKLKQKGTNWEFSGKGFISLSSYDMFFNESKNEIYAASYSGIFKSSDNGNSWFFYNNGFHKIARTSCITTLRNGTIFAGTVPNGIYTSTDKGNSWQIVNNGIRKASIYNIKSDSKGNVYAIDCDNNLYRSTNYGKLWVPIHINLPANYIYDYNLLIDSKDNLIISYYYSVKRDSTTYLPHTIIKVFDNGKKSY